MDIAFPNPEVKQVDNRDHLGNIWQAARAAGVQPATIRVWVSRRKIEPMPIAGGEPLFHLPTVQAAAKAGHRYTPADPAPNARGPHAGKAA